MLFPFTFFASRQPVREFRQRTHSEIVSQFGSGEGAPAGVGYGGAEHQQAERHDDQMDEFPSPTKLPTRKPPVASSDPLVSNLSLVR